MVKERVMIGWLKWRGQARANATWASRSALVFVCDPRQVLFDLKAYVRVSGCLGASHWRDYWTKSVLRLKQLLKIKVGPLLEKDRGPLGDLLSLQLPKHLPQD